MPRQSFCFQIVYVRADAWVFTNLFGGKKESMFYSAFYIHKMQHVMIHWKFISVQLRYLFLLRTMPLGVLCEKLKRTEEGVQKLQNWHLTFSIHYLFIICVQVFIAMLSWSDADGTLLVNPHLPSGPVHPYQLDQSISNFRSV